MEKCTPFHTAVLGFGSASGRFFSFPWEFYYFFSMALRESLGIPNKALLTNPGLLLLMPC
jgi:hypothetical protein